MLRTRDLQRRFDRAANDFDDADFVHAVTREGLVTRLEPLVLQPASILDLGAATGATGQLLRKRFKRAHIVSLDISRAMLEVARKNRTWFSRPSLLQANARQLPFADASFDMVVSNQLLPWLPDPRAVFEEVGRVLRDGGVFAFATLGPDSLRELGRAWATVDDRAHVNRFPDMHDIGDGLVRAGLRDPVLDVDRLSVSYEHPGKLFDDLTRVGGRNVLADRDHALTGKHRFRAMASALVSAQSGGPIVLELELVYGHCWGSGRSSTPSDYKINANRIPVRR